jgi:hypothetical protein
LFLRGFTTRWDELGPVCDVTTDLLVRCGQEISPKVFPVEALRTWTPLMDEIARDGLDL